MNQEEFIRKYEDKLVNLGFFHSDLFISDVLPGYDEFVYRNTEKYRQGKTTYVYVRYNRNNEIYDFAVELPDGSEYKFNNPDEMIAFLEEKMKKKRGW